MGAQYKQETSHKGQEEHPKQTKYYVPIILLSLVLMILMLGKVETSDVQVYYVQPTQYYDPFGAKIPIQLSSYSQSDLVTVDKKGYLPLDRVVYNRPRAKETLKRQQQEEREPLQEALRPIKCAIFISPHYKFIYVRNHKSGSMTTLGAFKVCKPKRNKQNTSSNPWCLYFADQVDDLKDTQKIWQEYYVFSTIRNPLVRAASLYKFLNYQSRRKDVGEEIAQQPQCNVKWTDYCQNPRVLVDHCTQMPQCCKINMDFLWSMHTDSQLGCQTDIDGNWVVDYLIRVENYFEDLNRLLTILNKRRDPSLPEIVLSDTRVRNVGQLPDNQESMKQTQNQQSDKSIQQTFQKSRRSMSSNIEGFDGQLSKKPADPLAQYEQMFKDYPQCKISLINYYKKDIIKQGYAD